MNCCVQLSPAFSSPDDLLDAEHLIDNRHILQIHVAGVGDGDRVGQLVADEGLRDVDRLGDGDVARLDGQLTGNKLEDIVRGEEVLPIREGEVALQDLVGLAALGARLAGKLTAEGGRLTRDRALRLIRQRRLRVAHAGILDGDDPLVAVRRDEDGCRGDLGGHDGHEVDIVIVRSLDPDRVRADVLDLRQLGGVVLAVQTVGIRPAVALDRAGDGRLDDRIVRRAVVDAAVGVGG